MVEVGFLFDKKNNLLNIRKKNLAPHTKYAKNSRNTTRVTILPKNQKEKKEIVSHNECNTRSLRPRLSDQYQPAQSNFRVNCGSDIIS